MVRLERMARATARPARNGALTAMASLPRPARWTAQVLLYAGFAALLALFSAWPVYRHLPPGEAVVALSILHQGQRLHECRQLDAEELAKLPPTMRMPTDCPRERAPLLLELDIDGATVLRREAPPSGLSGDGTAALFERLRVPAGPHALAVRLRDSARSEGFDYSGTATVELAPAQVLVIDFDAQRGVITFR